MQLEECYSRKLLNPSSLVSLPRSISRNVTFPLHSRVRRCARNDSVKGTEHGVDDGVNSFPCLFALSLSLSLLSVRGANVSKTSCRSEYPMS